MRHIFIGERQKGQVGQRSVVFELVSYGFFNSGVMIAIFWDAGRQPSRSDVLTIAVKYGRRTSTDSFSKSVGMGWSVHDFDMTVRRTLASEHDE